MRRLAVARSVPVVLALLAGTARAQLSGTYTIDASGSGPRNYGTIMSAVTDLWTQGVAGTVRFDVAAGPYPEEVTIVPVTGMSATNTITFRCATKYGAVLDRHLGFYLDAPTSPIVGVVFDGFTFRNTSSMLNGSASGVELRSCRFAGAGSANVQGSGWRIHHNLFESSANLNVSNAEDVWIHHNEFRDSRVSVSSTVFAASAKPVRIYNNLLFHTRTPIILGASAYFVEVAHNTVAVTPAFQTETCLLAQGGFFSLPTRIHGNIFVVNGEGYIVKLPYFDPLKVQLDGNLYFGFNTTKFIGTSLNYTDLAAWQKAGQDGNSIQADPQLVGGTNFTDLHIRATSPAVNRAVGTPAYVLDDFDGETRSRPDIGADEVRIPFEVFGTGCNGTSNIVPAIGHSGSPVIGSTDFTVQLTNALGGPSVRAWFLVGISDKTWGSIPLPLPLGGGCNLLVSAEAMFPLAVSGLPGAGNGTASVKLSIPNDPRLKGSRTFFQWGVADPAAKGIGIAFSNAARVQL